MDKYTLNPAVPGSIDNMVIGSLKPVAATFTSLSLQNNDGSVSLIGRITPTVLNPQNTPAAIQVQEGDVLILIGDSAASATVVRASDQYTRSIGPNAYVPIWAAVGTQSYSVSCASGSVSASVKSASVLVDTTSETVVSATYNYGSGVLQSLVETSSSGRMRTTTYTYLNGLATGYTVVGFDGRTQTVTYVYTNGAITGKTVSAWA